MSSSLLFHSLAIFTCSCRRTNSDNCRRGLYCDAPSQVCREAQPLGASCSADKECLSHVCADPTFKSTQPVTNDARGRCASRPRSSSPARPGLIAAILALVALSGLLLCVFLARLHAKGRQEKARQVRAYEAEQRALRADVWATYGAARHAIASSVSNPSSGAATPVKPRRISTASAASEAETPEMTLLGYHNGPASPAAPTTRGEKRNSRLRSEVPMGEEDEKDTFVDEIKGKTGQPF